MNFIGLKASQVCMVWSEFIMETLVEVMWKPDLVKLFYELTFVLGVCMLGLELSALSALLPWRDWDFRAVLKLCRSSRNLEFYVSSRDMVVFICENFLSWRPVISSIILCFSS